MCAVALGGAACGVCVCVVFAPPGARAGRTHTTPPLSFSLGRPLAGPRIFRLPLDEPTALTAAALSGSGPPAGDGPRPPTIFRGTFTIRRLEEGEGEGGGDGGGGGRNSSHARFPFPPDTWADLGGGSVFAKGLLFLNGRNAGWYWPARGPQNTLFLPGPWLAWGENEVVLVEVGGGGGSDGGPPLALDLVAAPDYGGPGGAWGGGTWGGGERGGGGRGPHGLSGRGRAAGEGRGVADA